MHCRLCLPNCSWIDGFGRQSLQDSAFPGRSLGTSLFLVAIGEKCLFFHYFSFSGSIICMSAIEDQPEAAEEIHWSCSNGNPLSKYG